MPARPISNRRQSFKRFLPPAIATLQLWLSADSGVYSDTAFSTPIFSDGSTVGGWKDKGTFGNHAIQATGANRPVWKANAINNRPGVQFTAASSQWLSANGAAVAFSGSNLPVTIIAALQLTTTPTEIVVAIANSGAAAQHWLFYVNGTPLWANDKHDDTTHSFTITGGTPNTNPNIVSWVGNGATLQIFVNGASIVGPSAQSIAPTTLNDFGIGVLNSNGTQSLFLNGVISELFCWSSSLSSGDRQQVETYLDNRYKAF